MGETQCACLLFCFLFFFTSLPAAASAAAYLPYGRGRKDSGRVVLLAKEEEEEGDCALAKVELACVGRRVCVCLDGAVAQPGTVPTLLLHLFCSHLQIKQSATGASPPPPDPLLRCPSTCRASLVSDGSERIGCLFDRPSRMPYFRARAISGSYMHHKHHTDVHKRPRRCCIFVFVLLFFSSLQMFYHLAREPTDAGLA